MLDYLEDTWTPDSDKLVQVQNPKKQKVETWKQLKSDPRIHDSDRPLPKETSKDEKNDRITDR
jgi:hypothetical protein